MRNLPIIIGPPISNDSLVNGDTLIHQLAYSEVFVMEIEVRVTITSQVKTVIVNTIHIMQIIVNASFTS